MALTAGTRLGPYEVIAPLGAGGMGEVYRAHDTALHRDVAIKVLLTAVANDPDRLARFSREAQVLASLNHPNIAHIHGIEDSNGIKALILELVDGEDLAQRIARGPIPLDEALAIARQIADALEAAHEQGVIHRDLKPANIKLRPDGTIKILDFGLAKALDPAGASGANAMNSPTLSLHATQAGLILGTAAYMSPEQARGGLVDRRADIWSFGVVLFEMLTGRRAFDGDTVSDTLASVLKSDPELNALPRDVPPSIRRLLALCLKKDRKARLADAGEARRQIEDVISGGAVVETAAATTRPGAGWWQVLPWAVAAAALALAAALGWQQLGRSMPTPVYASIDAPADFVFGEDDRLVSLPTRTPMVFTPDGRSLILQVARASRPTLVMRPLDRPDARPIPGTDDARTPFVSPDGKWIGFWAANELRKIPIEGGTPTTICALKGVLGPYGASWSKDDVIVFGDETSGRLMRVSAGGGSPVPVTAPPKAGSGRMHVAPLLLPDGRRVLYSEVSTEDARDSRLMVQSLDGGDGRLVLEAASDGRLLPSGRLAFMRLGTLMNVAFDLDRAEVKGTAIAAITNVMQSGMRGRLGALNTAEGMFAVSSLGTLAAIRGPVTGADDGTLLAWVTQAGAASSAEPASGPPIGARLFARMSPDQSRAIIGVTTPMGPQTWLADWTRDVWIACNECSANRGLTLWSTDGRRLLFGRYGTLVTHLIDGSSADQVLLDEADRFVLPMAWTADGRIVYLSGPDQTTFEIKYLEPGASSGRVIAPLGTGADATVSPDGHWLAYTMQTEPTNVVVQAFPGPGSRTQASAGGGRNPAWSADGRTLYYLDVGRNGSSLFAVDLHASDTMSAGTPRELFHLANGQGCAGSRCYDVAADGRRFLMRSRAATARQTVTRMDLVLNWSGTLAK